MKQHWDERYQQKEYAYGIEPSAFLKEQLANVSVGSVLFPAEGEGRNAVYAATLGWQVSAFDQSDEGKKKAMLLSQQNNVTIDYQVTDLENIYYTPKQFDALVLIYAHFPEEHRVNYHKKLANYVRSGGLLLLEGFSKKHFEFVTQNPKVGGPKDISMLFSIEELKSDFSDFEFSFISEKVVHLNEGIYHKGNGSIIHLVGIKK